MWNQHHLELCIQSFPHRDRSITPHGHSTFCYLANPTPEANPMPLVVIAVATTTEEETHGYQSSSAMLSPSPPPISLFFFPISWLRRAQVAFHDNSVVVVAAAAIVAQFADALIPSLSLSPLLKFLYAN